MLSQEGALTGALNWYRGTGGIRPDRSGGGDFGPVATPTLHFWGNADNAIGRPPTLACRDYMTGPHRLISLACGHRVGVLSGLGVGGLVGHEVGVDTLGSEGTDRQRARERRVDTPAQSEHPPPWRWSQWRRE